MVVNRGHLLLGFGRLPVQFNVFHKDWQDGDKLQEAFAALVDYGALERLGNTGAAE